MERNMTYQARGDVAIAAAAVLLGGCGGGKPVEKVTTPPSIEVRVSAGSPVAGALVTVYAVSDATGQVDVSAGAGGVLGSAGPTDGSGRVSVGLRGYSGPIQVVAGGPALFYVDPASPPDQSGAQPIIQMPASFVLSSYVTRFRAGASPVIPVTLLTTLADRAALAYARGLHSAAPGRRTITDAVAARDPVVVAHMTRAAAAWDPGSLRSTVPAPLAKGPQSLVDVAFAALFDIALNQLARDTSALAGYGAGSGGLTAPTLLQLLNEDLDADGRLDGLAEAGRVIRTAGSSPVVMDAQFLKLPLAVALAAWVRNADVNRSGISDADLASAQVFKAITEDTSDLFGPAPIQTFDPLDRTPPEIALVGPAPAYSRSQLLHLAVSAKDASGVKAVYARAGAVDRAAELRDGVWLLDIPLPSVGHNAVTIWAEDRAQPGSNSGRGLDLPHQITLDVMFDPDPPSATYDAAFASCFDERGMAVASGADGLARLPAAYSVGARTGVPNGGHIYKAATRLAPEAPPDAAELEVTNSANIPVLRFSVPFRPSTDAPITTARYTVAASCTGCGALPAATGSLLPSPTPTPQALQYLLPLTTDTVPALGAALGPVTLTVTLDLADAAGNEATITGFGFTFHVIGPPLAVVEDTGYPGYGDPRSTYPYRVAGPNAGVDSYDTLWKPDAPSFFGNAVRLLRYVISNPSPQPVAVSATFGQAAGGSWKVAESWMGAALTERPSSPILSDPSSAAPFVIDGFVFHQATYWATPYGTAGANLGGTEIGPFPCAGGHLGGYAAHRIGDRATKWTCIPSMAGATETSVFSTGPVAASLFAGHQQGGGEVLAPDRDAGGTMFVVPGASGAVPGTLVLYLTRPLAATRTRPLQLNALGAQNRYETYDYEAFRHVFTWSIASRAGAFTYEVFMAFRSGQYLQSSTETLDGSLTVTSQGLVAGRLAGEPATPFAESYARSIATH
jgi:hypothetical protein